MRRCIAFVLLLLFLWQPSAVAQIRSPSTSAGQVDLHDIFRSAGIGNRELQTLCCPHGRKRPLCGNACAASENATTTGAPQGRADPARGTRPAASGSQRRCAAFAAAAAECRRAGVVACSIDWRCAAQVPKRRRARAPGSNAGGAMRSARFRGSAERCSTSAAATWLFRRWTSTCPNRALT